jgi:hypothetical protein
LWKNSVGFSLEKAKRIAKSALSFFNGAIEMIVGAGKTNGVYVVRRL